LKTACQDNLAKNINAVVNFAPSENKTISPVPTNEIDQQHLVFSLSIDYTLYRACLLASKSGQPRTALPASHTLQHVKQLKLLTHLTQNFSLLRLLTLSGNCIKLMPHQQEQKQPASAKKISAQNARYMFHISREG
jgi:hypothetical protein